MDDDVRKNFILSTAANYFSFEPKEFTKKFYTDRQLGKFLDDLNVIFLIVNSSDETRFIAKLDNLASLTGKSLIFFKAKSYPEALTPENIKTNVQISSIVDSPVDSLFHLIHNVYSPVLQLYQSQNSRSTDAFDSKLSNTLAELEANLKVVIQRAETSNSGRRSALSPLDEFQYWADMAEKAKSKEGRERAVFFYDEFKPLVKLYSKIENCPISEILEIIELTQDSYDYVWQQDEHEPKYSQERMTNLLEITNSSIQNKSSESISENSDESCQYEKIFEEKDGSSRLFIP